MKPIEDRVKEIVEKKELLNIKEKSEIICLIECYKSADSLAQKYFKHNEKMKALINKIISLLEPEPDLYYLIEELEEGLKE